MDKKELGNVGENIAKGLLIRKNYEILDRNWRFGKFEIDIICRKGDKIVFVEVKTRENGFIQPWETVSIAQQKRIIKAANEYLTSKDLNVEARFDIVSIIYNREFQNVEHFEDAFYPRV